MENIGETKIKGLYLGGRDLLAEPVDGTARAAAAEAGLAAEAAQGAANRAQSAADKVAADLLSDRMSNASYQDRVNQRLGALEPRVDALEHPSVGSVAPGFGQVWQDGKLFYGRCGYPADTVIPTGMHLGDALWEFYAERQLSRRDVLMPWECMSDGYVQIAPVFPPWGGEEDGNTRLWPGCETLWGGNRDPYPGTAVLHVTNPDGGPDVIMGWNNHVGWRVQQPGVDGWCRVDNNVPGSDGNNIFLCLKGKSGGLNGNKGFVPLAQGQTFESDPGAPLLQFVKAHRSDSVVDPGLDKHWAGLFFIKGKMADGSEKYWCATRKRSADGSGWEFGFDVAKSGYWTREVTSCWAVW